MPVIMNATQPTYKVGEQPMLSDFQLPHYFGTHQQMEQGAISCFLSMPGSGRQDQLLAKFLLVMFGFVGLKKIRDPRRSASALQRPLINT